MYSQLKANIINIFNELINKLALSRILIITWIPVIVFALPSNNDISLSFYYSIKMLNSLKTSDRYRINKIIHRLSY
jgi:hypothetical protein